MMHTTLQRWTVGTFVAVALTLTACEKTLDVQPRTSLDSGVALSTPEGLDAALNGIYDRLQSTRMYGRDLMAIPEALADNGEATNKSGRLNAEYRNVQNNHFANWATGYFAINQANLVIEAAQKLTGLTEARKNAFLGQAYFLRALFYHDLLRAYAYDPGVEIKEYDRGGVPLVTAGVTNETQLILPARASVKEGYDLIYNDLTQAITLLGNTAGPVYATKGAAQALFSRVALYRKDYPTAVKQATDALGSNVAQFLTTPAAYLSGWRSARHPESMFELVFLTPENIGVNESLQTTYTTLVELGNRTRTGGFGDLVPSASLLADLESERSGTTVLDIRRQLYELGTAGRGPARIECTKFLGKNGIINLDNIPVIRISEAYLNRAEANAMLGNAADALADVNAIRTRSGLTARTGLTGDALLTEILKQRRIEMAFEGHRWFDLKRRGQDVIKPAVANLPYTDPRFLANIPVNELATNPNIRQNFGY